MFFMGNWQGLRRSKARRICREHTARCRKTYTGLLWPGPLHNDIQEKACHSRHSHGRAAYSWVRVPSHPVALNLTQDAGKNPSPHQVPTSSAICSPTRVHHVAKSFAERVPLVLDGGNSQHGIESTIVSSHEGGVFVDRHGAMTIEELSEHVRVDREGKRMTICETPGELPYHYAPMKPFAL